MSTVAHKSPVTEIAPADPMRALQHFEGFFEFETDCGDIRAALRSPAPDVVPLDVRGPEHFRQGHIAGAVNLPHARISERNLAEYPDQTIFVVHCADRHCNEPDRASIRLARLGRAVRKPVAGVTGWSDERVAPASAPWPEG